LSKINAKKGFLCIGFCVGGIFHPKGETLMNTINAIVDITLKTEEEILAFDVSDEALEIAAGTVSDKANFTFGDCTLQQIGCPG
jgi:hypothetical protein